MTNEERDIIAAFIARVGGAASSGGGTWGGNASVPATQAPRPALPPVDPEADSFIAQQFQAYPEARYRITQLAFVQEHALIEAQNRLRRLEWELQQAQQAAQQQQQAGGQRQGGFFSSLFGGGRPAGGAPREWRTLGKIPVRRRAAISRNTPRRRRNIRPDISRACFSAAARGSSARR